MDRDVSRGKETDNGEWVKGYFVPDGRGGVIIGEAVDYSEEYFNPLFWYPVDPSTIGRCTGVCDKNGMLIFEGDIVRTKRGVGYIKWHNKGLTGWLVEYADCRELIYSDNRQEYEVIGNIHDNPELVGG